MLEVYHNPNRIREILPPQDISVRRVALHENNMQLDQELFDDHFNRIVICQWVKQQIKIFDFAHFWRKTDFSLNGTVET